MNNEKISVCPKYCVGYTYAKLLAKSGWVTRGQFEQREVTLPDFILKCKIILEVAHSSSL